MLIHVSHSDPKLSNILADLLTWILEHMGVSPFMHYLDDFLTLGPPDTLTCSHNLQVIQGICQHLCVPMALEKVEGPSESLTFLGILLDTENMEARLPHDKLQRIRSQVATWLGRWKAKKRQILSLVGLLQHATKVVKPGRTFVAQMYKATTKLQQPHHVTSTTKVRFTMNLHTFATHLQPCVHVTICLILHVCTTHAHHIC